MRSSPYELVAPLDMHHSGTSSGEYHSASRLSKKSAEKEATRCRKLLLLQRNPMSLFSRHRVYRARCSCLMSVVYLYPEPLKFWFASSRRLRTRGRPRERERPLRGDAFSKPKKYWKLPAVRGHIWSRRPRTAGSFHYLPADHFFLIWHEASLAAGHALPEARAPRRGFAPCERRPCDGRVAPWSPSGVPLTGGARAPRSQDLTRLTKID